MKSVESQLLESLGHGVRLFDTGAAPKGGKGGVESGAGFDQMLEGARAGNPNTELGIRFAPSVSGMFDQEGQFKIARAVDRAAAAGVDHALILHDQRTLRVDVRNRIVLDVEPISDEAVIEGIDGFVAVQTPKPLRESNETDETDDSQEIERPRGTIPAPARVVRNASLVHALAGRVPD
jgi:hypothetical protein